MSIPIKKIPPDITKVFVDDSVAFMNEAGDGTDILVTAPYLKALVQLYDLVIGYLDKHQNDLELPDCIQFLLKDVLCFTPEKALEILREEMRESDEN